MRPFRLRILSFFIFGVFIAQISASQKSIPVATESCAHHLSALLELPLAEASDWESFIAALPEVYHRKKKDRIRDLEEITKGLPAIPKASLEKLKTELIALFEKNLFHEAFVNDAIDLFVKAEKDHAQAIEKLAKDATLVPGKSTESRNVSSLNDLLSLNSEIHLTPETNYSVQFERPSPLPTFDNRRPHQVRFSKEVLTMISDPSRLHGLKDWIDCVCKGWARADGMSGIKIFVGGKNFAHPQVELKLNATSQKFRAWGYVEPDGTFYFSKVLEH